jgi:hypothetical protein
VQVYIILILALILGAPFFVVFGLTLGSRRA